MLKNIRDLTTEEKEEIFKNKIILKELFKKENHAKFAILLRNLKKNEAEYLNSDLFLQMFFEDRDKLNKLYIIMSLTNVDVNNLLKQQRMLYLIFNYVDSLEGYLPNLNSEFALAYGKYIIDNHLDTYYIHYLNSSGELAVIKKYKDILAKRKVDIEFLLDLKKDSIEYLLEDKYYQSLLLNTRVDYINNILSKGVVFSVELQDNKIMIDKYLNIYNINKYHEYHDNLNKNIYLYENVKNSRDKLYDKLINDLDYKLNIFNEYTYILNKQSNFRDELYNIKYLDALNKRKDPLEFLQELTITRMLEMTIDKYFDDLTYNFLKNVESMLDYQNKIEDLLIPINRMKIYNKFLNYYNLSMEERINLYNELNSFSKELFYDDFTSIKKHANKKIKDSLFQPSPDKLEENELGLKTYTLEGEDFKLLVTATKFMRNSEKYPDTIWNKVHDIQVSSLSLISNQNINTYRNPYEKVILAFNDYNIDNIIITYESDAYTDSMGSNRIQRFYQPDELINKTTSCNEIEISEKYEDLKPNYVVCYDRIKQGDIEASKLLGNIPFIVIDTSKYEFKDNFCPSKDVYRCPEEVSGTISYRK